MYCGLSRQLIAEAGWAGASCDEKSSVKIRASPKNLGGLTREIGPTHAVTGASNDESGLSEFL
jgi:hypothetical protein